MSEPMENDRFAITDDSAAEWAIRRIREKQEDTQRWKEHYDHQLATIKESNDRDIAYFEGLLAEYFGKVPHHDTKTMRKYSLPSADLVLKHQQPEWEHDDSVLLPWLKEVGETQYIKVKETLDWAGMKKELTVTEDGEIIYKPTGEVLKDGVTRTERGDKFEVNLK